MTELTLKSRQLGSRRENNCAQFWITWFSLWT